MKIKTIIIIAAAIILCGFFSSIFVFDPFNLHLNFFNRELSIEKTANVISEIKKISEFTTACYFEDKIIEQKKYKYFEKKINKQEQREQNAKDIKTSAVSSFKKLKEAASSAIDRAKQWLTCNLPCLYKAVTNPIINLHVKFLFVPSPYECEEENNI